MAIYHFSAKKISRLSGRSSVEAAAYRAAEKIIDTRTGEIHDYSRKSGVFCSAVFLPNGGSVNRGELWNAVENKHKRRDAIVAREFEISLPLELSMDQRVELAFAYAKEVADQYGVAVDIALHAPKIVTNSMVENNPGISYVVDSGTKSKHNGNWHMHIMITACHANADGILGNKCVELDPIHCQRAKIGNAVDQQRLRWQVICNAALENAGSNQRIDRRSLLDQGITDRQAGIHYGPEISGILRRGEISKVVERHNKKVVEIIVQQNTDVTIEATCQFAHADAVKIEQERRILKENPTPVLAKEKPIVYNLAKRNEFSDLTIDALEYIRDLRVNELNIMFMRIQTIENKRLRAKSGGEITSAKNALLDLSKRMELLKGTMKSRLLIIEGLNSRFGGFYEFLPKRMTPNRAHLQNLIEIDKAAVTTLQLQIDQVRAVADSPDRAQVALDLVSARERSAQLKAEIKDIDDSVIEARQRESSAKPVHARHSSMVPRKNRMRELSL